MRVIPRVMLVVLLHARLSRASSLVFMRDRSSGLSTEDASMAGQRGRELADYGEDIFDREWMWKVLGGSLCLQLFEIAAMPGLAAAAAATAENSCSGLRATTAKQ